MTFSHRLRTTRARRCGGERGAIAVEFALVLPVLILIIFGIVEFGRGYNAKVGLTAAAREGARYLAVDKDADADAVVAATKGAADGLDSSKLSVTSSDAPCKVGEQATVTAQYDFEYTIPLYGSATIGMSSTGVMRCGG